MQTKPFVILAPHVDDEVIGCWTLLNIGLVSDVYYFFELSSTRQDEAIRCSERYEFTPHCVTVADILEIDFSDKIILAPNIKDHHPDHKKINKLAKQITCKQLIFYSVDMNDRNKQVLGHSPSEVKQAHLDLTFPSQKELWASDAKYFLLESLSNNDSKSFIWVTYSVVGVHSYPDAPDEVSYLKWQHRHKFNFKVKIEVFHEDREVEFHMFKTELENLYKDGSGKMLDANDKSCEMLAKDVERYLQMNYPGRAYTIDVDEDGENGAQIMSGDYTQ